MEWGFGNIPISEIKYYLSNVAFPLQVVYAIKSLVGNMELKETQCHSEVVDPKEKVEATLARLQSIKRKVSELRLQLEALRELQAEKQEKALLCYRCGKAIRKGKEIRIKGSLGEIKRSYHEGCFKAVLSS